MKVFLKTAKEIRKAIRNGIEVFIKWPIGVDPIRVKDARLREGELEIKHCSFFDTTKYIRIWNPNFSFKDGKEEVYYEINND